MRKDFKHPRFLLFRLHRTSQHTVILLAQHCTVKNTRTPNYYKKEFKNFRQKHCSVYHQKGKTLAQLPLSLNLHRLKNLCPAFRPPTYPHTRYESFGLAGRGITCLAMFQRFLTIGRSS
eukprot:PhF_6_TR420/c0_g1_i1/m.136